MQMKLLLGDSRMIWNYWHRKYIGKLDLAGFDGRKIKTEVYSAETYEVLFLKQIGVIEKSTDDRVKNCLISERIFVQVSQFLLTSLTLTLLLLSPILSNVSSENIHSKHDKRNIRLKRYFEASILYSPSSRVTWYVVYRTTCSARLAYPTQSLIAWSSTPVDEYEWITLAIDTALGIEINAFKHLISKR